MADLTEAQIREILAGCEGATPGPWTYATDDEGSSMGWLECRSDFPPPHGRDIADINGDSAEQAINAAHIARLDPATVAALCNMALRSSAAEAKIVEQAADVVGFAEAIAELDAKLPGAFWHVAKGRLCESEPLYAALILFGEEEVGHGEHLTSIAEAVRIATSAALAEIGSGK